MRLHCAVRFRRLPCLALLTLFVAIAMPVPAAETPVEVVLVRDGRAQLPLVAGSVPEPVDELRRYLTRISGAQFQTASTDRPRRGIFVGLAEDFPEHDFENVAALGDEGFLIRSDGRGLLLVARTPLGVQHAVVTFLQELGCRWFFPGEAWEVVPRRRTIAGSWDRRASPDFPVQRRIWPGFGLYRPNAEDWSAWDRHNRMGGPVTVCIHHSWFGLRGEKDFAEHPEWFGLVDGRRQPAKPCYSHPDVVRRAKSWALDRAAASTEMITLSAPDGLGFCECERCLAVLGGATPFKQHGTTWGRRPDGTLLNVTAETLFGFVNEVAAAGAKKHPDAIIGCYAY
ncbi:MAG: DUF4838 domain-containing protein, partial [Candidatus Nealsonbacteria bacterium]|nr:DUF4838 domain-containing protein [Candidatus Nealsonbacteria bacterium]